MHTLQYQTPQYTLIRCAFGTAACAVTFMDCIAASIHCVCALCTYVACKTCCTNTTLFLCMYAHAMNRLEQARYAPATAGKLLGGSLLAVVMKEFAAVRNGTTDIQLHIHSTHYPVSSITIYSSHTSNDVPLCSHACAYTAALV
jgi:hypothetical protein